jgi:hypothetical protein
MNSVDASVTGAFLSVGTGQSAVLGGARLAADGADATAVIRETDGSGRVLAKLAAKDGEADELRLPIRYTGNIHVTVAGAGAVCNVFQP